MPATPAYTPPVFQPAHWQTELVAPRRTAHGVRENAGFFNSPNSPTAFAYDSDAIQEDRLRDLERGLETLARQLQRRLELQKDAFRLIPSETPFAHTFPFALFFLATNAEAVSVDATPDASVFFTADYPQRGRVYIEVFFADEQAEPIEAVVNIYAADNRCVMAYAGPVRDTLREIFQFIQANFGA